MTALARLLLLFAAAFAAGVVNALAGGGTLLTFPALLSAGVPPVAANATSTVALVPGSFSAFWGYRIALPRDRRLFWAIFGPSLVGGFLGAWVVAHVSDAFFRQLVPWLILGATGLFMLQGPLRRGLARGVSAHSEPRTSGGWLVLVVLTQTVVSVYGGFFGAGMGILMLALFGLVGFSDLHEMNGLKNLASVAINGVASVTFALTGKVHFGTALLMAVGAALGGYAGAGLARRVGQAWVRRCVSGVGLSIGLYFLLRR